MKTLKGDWKVWTVLGNVYGDVCGDVRGDVRGTVRGTVDGHRWQRHRWQPVETPQEKLERLIQESGDQELMKAFKQLQENN
jgi:hypothetical protein